MSKKNENVEKVNLPVSPSSYSYMGDETITMSAQVFMIFWKAVEDALTNSIERKFVSRPEWVSTVTGELLSGTPSVDEVNNGLVKQATSLEKTFNNKDFSNFAETFQDWVYPNVVNAKLAVLEVHAQMIEKGISRPIEELKQIVASQRDAAQNPQVGAEGKPEAAQRPAPTKTTKKRTPVKKLTKS